MLVGSYTLPWKIDSALMATRCAPFFALLVRVYPLQDWGRAI